MRKFAFVFLAVFTTLLFSLSAHSQSSASAESADTNEKQSRYDVFGGAAGTTLNQIVHGHGLLVGFEAGVTRNWGKYFGLNAQVASMSYNTSDRNNVVLGVTPNYTQFLVGPEIHAPLYERLSGGIHVLFGPSHTGGTNVVGTPNISFSNDLGAYLRYRLKPRFSVQLSGDRVATSFVQGASSLGYTPHRYSNIQSAIGVVYHF